MRILPLLACLLLPATADALIFRAYVAADGSDANPCTLPQPCRLLPAALNAVANKGEIWMLDSANYNTGPVIVTKSVSILAVPGVVGSIVATGGGPGLSVAGSLDVSLRNLVIAPLVGTSHSHGVDVANGARVSIEDSVIANLNTGHGVSASTGARVSVINTIFRGLGGQGVYAESGARVQVTGSRFVNSTGGIWSEAAATHTTTISVSDSSLMYTGLSGALARSTGGTALINLTRSTIDFAGAALTAETDASVASVATITVNACTIGNNNWNWYKTGATAAIVTYGNNQFGRHDQPNQGSLTVQGLE